MLSMLNFLGFKTEFVMLSMLNFSGFEDLICDVVACAVFSGF